MYSVFPRPLTYSRHQLARRRFALRFPSGRRSAPRKFAQGFVFEEGGLEEACPKQAGHEACGIRKLFGSWFEAQLEHSFFEDFELGGGCSTKYREVPVGRNTATRTQTFK